MRAYCYERQQASQPKNQNTNFGISSDNRNSSFRKHFGCQKYGGYHIFERHRATLRLSRK